MAVALRLQWRRSILEVRKTIMKKPEFKKAVRLKDYSFLLSKRGQKGCVRERIRAQQQLLGLDHQLEAVPNAGLQQW
ncbi:hypothetical protein KY289_026157 [Solanum tuberosum]|nr:hypothetical protein KY289_026157 [Solanum tuberosum]